jgi:glycosyltransferase involved in cell wall biosynthesis
MITLDKKNVAIIVTKLNGGGAERVASNLSMELSQYYNISLIVFDGQNQTYPYGGELIDLKMPPCKGLFGKLRNLYKRVGKVRNIKKERNIVCSISLMDGPNLVNIFSKMRDRVITSVRIFMSESRKSKLLEAKFSMYLIALYSDKIVSLSHAVKKDLVKNFKIKESKIIPIYNSCNDKRLLELSNEDDKDYKRNENLYVVTMGRLTYQKGHWHLIRAFKHVLKVLPNTDLFILGEGDKFDKLNNLAKGLGIETHVKFLGYKKNPHNFVSGCDVFVLPSLFEGLGNVLLEAMACGKACISSDCNAGPREILAPSTDIDKKTDKIELAQYGILVPVCDGNHDNVVDPLTHNELLLAEAIIMLLQNKDLREEYEKKSIERAKDFNSSFITKEWVSLINSFK